MDQETASTEIISPVNRKVWQLGQHDALIIGIALIISGMYIFFFVESAVKWVLIGMLAGMYIIIRLYS